MGYWNRKEELAAKAKVHTKQMKEKYPTEISDCVRNTKIYTTDFSLGDKLQEAGKRSQRVASESNTELIGATTTEAIKLAKAKKDAGKIAILNFASYKNPGGKFLEGSSAQEESLCHESFLYNVLKEFEIEYYDWNRQNLNGALYQNRALYSPDVTFTIDGESYVVDVLTCAAPNKKAALKYGHANERSNWDALMSRIRFVLDVAADNGVDTLILGAFGCGVFGQDPYHVAYIFLMHIKHYNFKKIIYAIPYGTNYAVFDDVRLESLKLNLPW